MMACLTVKPVACRVRKRGVWRGGSMLFTWPCRQLVTCRQGLRSVLLQFVSTGLLLLLCALSFVYYKTLSCPSVSMMTISAFIHCLVLPGMRGWRMSHSAQQTPGPATGLLHACGFCKDGTAGVAMQLRAKD